MPFDAGETGAGRQDILVRTVVEDAVCDSASG